MEIVEESFEKENNDKIKVVELFAGVGGFRLGLERASNRFKTIWANQWEPSSKAQHAADIYNFHWNDNTLSNVDIVKAWQNLPTHDLLVGGFPCQDYSVAHGNKAKGIKGKKGILWWEIYKIIQSKNPKMIFLENVDRLLKSPSNQRGRDFSIMIRALNDLGYLVEWMNINAADYGFFQKRRRVYILAYKPKKNILPNVNFLEKHSILAKSFPISKFVFFKTFDISSKIYKNLASLTDNYGEGKFGDIGVAIKGRAFSSQYEPNKSSSRSNALINILEKKGNFRFLTKEQKTKMDYMKSNKKISRINKSNGFEYSYSEGKMNFPEDLFSPGRTMLTSEGTLNRSSHFIKEKNKIRFLTAIEAERLNGFPDNWTAIKHDRFRYFAMGNALVVDVVERIGKTIAKIYN